MGAFDLVQLSNLMERSEGNSAINVALIDGPIAVGHQDLGEVNIQKIAGPMEPRCLHGDSVACQHGTFVAGILFSKRGGSISGICPKCTLLVRPIFAEEVPAGKLMPTASPQGLADAIIACVDGGARIINLSASIVQFAPGGDCALDQALSYAARREVIVIAAAGNQGTVAGSKVDRHPWVIPVVASDLTGQPLRGTNLGLSIGRRGLSAPGENIRSLGTSGDNETLSGTSAAAPFVTGTAALLWSLHPNASATDVKVALFRAAKPSSRKSVVPPLLNAWGALRELEGTA
jgi:subtilisin family serine protease